MSALQKKRQFKSKNKDFNSLTKVKVGTKSVPSLPAQTNILLHSGNGQGIDLNSYYDRLCKSSDLNGVDKAVIEIMLFYGLRISEVLRIRPIDVLPNGYIKITGSKGSNDRMIYPYKNSAYWLKVLRASLPLDQNYSRFYFYRLFKRKGLYEKFNSNHNNSVTHYFRHKLLSSFNSSQIELETRKQFIGHKSEKSTKYYE